MASLSSFILSPSPFSVIDFVGIVDGGDEGQLWWCAGEMMMLDGGVGSAVVVEERERWGREREKR